MANFATTIFPGSITTALLDPNKGSINNKFNCVGEHIKNNAVSYLQAGLVGGSAAGVTYAAYKSPKTAQVITKGLKGVQTLMSKNKYTSKVAGFITKALSKFSTTGKIGVIAAALALPVLAYIDHKHTYKAGQIDQKYTDKAQVASQLDNFITLNKMS